MKSLILTLVCLFIAGTLYSQKVRNTDIVEAPEDRLLYIPVQRGCVFQGYREGLPPCNNSIVISPQPTQVKRGSELVLSVSSTGPIGNSDLVDYKWDVQGTDSFGKSLIIGSAAQQSVKLSTHLGQSILKDVLWIFVRITVNKKCSSEGQVRIKVVN